MKYKIVVFNDTNKFLVNSLRHCPNTIPRVSQYHREKLVLHLQYGEQEFKMTDIGDMESSRFQFRKIFCRVGLVFFVVPVSDPINDQTRDSLALAKLLVGGSQFDACHVVLLFVYQIEHLRFHEMQPELIRQVGVDEPHQNISYGALKSDDHAPELRTAEIFMDKIQGVFGVSPLIQLRKQNSDSLMIKLSNLFNLKTLRRRSSTASTSSSVSESSPQPGEKSIRKSVSLEVMKSTDRLPRVHNIETQKSKEF